MNFSNRQRTLLHSRVTCQPCHAFSNVLYVRVAQLIVRSWRSQHLRMAIWGDSRWGSTDDWATRRLGDKRLGDKTFGRKTFGRHGWDDEVIALGESINITDTVIRQVMCKGRADIIQRNLYTLPKSLILFRNQGLRVCRIRWTHVLSIIRGLWQAATHITGMKTVQNDVDSNKFTWTEAVNLTQNQRLWRSLATSAVALCTCRGACQRRQRQGIPLLFRHTYASVTVSVLASEGWWEPSPR